MVTWCEGEERVGAGRRETGSDSMRKILPEKAGRAEQKGEGKAWLW